MIGRRMLIVKCILIIISDHYVHLAKKAPEKSPTKNPDQLGKKKLGLHVMSCAL